MRPSNSATTTLAGPRTLGFPKVRLKVLKGPDQAKMKGLVKNGEWNDYVIRAEGKRIQLWINGVQTVDYTEEDPKIEATGVVCPQIHAGPPSEAWYKDVTILDLTR